MMKEKIMKKASELFIKLGFKSVTMDDIACEMCISKKTIYKYFCNKEILIAESTEKFHNEVHTIIDSIIAKNYNAIQENFEVKKMFKEMFNSVDASPTFQLKKYYPEIYNQIISREIDKCDDCFKENILKGIEQNLYRKEIDPNVYAKFYYTLIFYIKENISTEKESNKLEIDALEYHIRAMATKEGTIELEKQLEIAKLNY